MKKTITAIILCISTINAVEKPEFCTKLEASTIDREHCKHWKMKESEREMNNYLSAAQKRYSDDKKFISLLQKSQAMWIKYSESECLTYEHQWSGGSISTYMYLECKLHMTKQRTYRIWDNYLTFMDSTPPLLPEPKTREGER
jgi:uncharacterized protein YecT (DUF1311 family)